MTTQLKKEYKINIPPRTKERFEMLCAIFTIVNALEMVFNVDGGLHAGTEDEPNEFHPIQILDIEPFLFCTEEIAVFALTHISEEIVNPNEFKVLKAIWDLHKKTNVYREEVQTTADSKRIAIPDHNYIKVNNGKRLLTEIINNIPANAGKMSKHNVQAILNDWNERCIDTHVYQEGNQLMPRDRKFNDTYPEPLNTTKDKKIALIFDLSNTYIHVHMFRHVRKDKYVNIVKESIKTLNHRYAVLNRKYILGCNERKKSIITYPHILDTITLKRNLDKTIKLLNPLYTDSVSKTVQGVKRLSKKQKKKMELVKLDLTAKGALVHATTLKKGIGFAKGTLEQNHEFGVSDNPIVYPTLILKRPNETNVIDEEDITDKDFEGAEVEDIFGHRNKRQRN